MTRFFRRGTSKVKWITAPASPTAPTLAEITAGVSLDAQIAEIYTRFVALADRKKNVYDQDLMALIPVRVPVKLAA